LNLQPFISFRLPKHFVKKVNSKSSNIQASGRISERIILAVPASGRNFKRHASTVESLRHIGNLKINVNIAEKRRAADYLKMRPAGASYAVGTGAPIGRTPSPP
jgi:hypothetical protein